MSTEQKIDCHSANAREKQQTVSDAKAETLLDVPPLKFADTPLGRMSYREAGYGPTILFLHGLNGSSKSWLEQFRFFSSRFRTIAWDAPGYGESDIIVSDVDTYADAARLLLDHAGVGEAAVVGHSMGGVVAGRLACRQPHRVSRLILSCTHTGNAVSPDQPLAEKYIKRTRELEQMSRLEYGRLRASRMLPDDADPDVFNSVAELASEVRAEGLLAAGAMVQKADNRSLLLDIKVPSLVISADRDTIVPPERAALLLDVISTATHITMKGLAHAPYLEAPEVFNAIIENFISLGDGKA